VARGLQRLARLHEGPVDRGRERGDDGRRGGGAAEVCEPRDPVGFAGVAEADRGQAGDRVFTAAAGSASQRAGSAGERGGKVECPFCIPFPFVFPFE
jgi:hypothetical protein